MYLQITTRCNMTCAHCCMNCNHEGEDMPIHTVKKALEVFGAENVSIGGGEPTIHPQFWEIFGIVMGASLLSCDLVPSLVTNGSMTDISLALAALAQKGAIGCSLSQDDYHDPIDEKVVRAFTVKDRFVRSAYGDVDGNDDLRDIRNVSGHEINAGRCDFGNEDDCVCNDFIVQPDGSVKLCGCDEAPIVGNVHEGFDGSGIYFEDDHCCKCVMKEEVCYA